MIDVPTHENSSALAASALDAGQRGEMFELLSRHFDGVDPGQFDRDLAEKNWVLQLRRNGRLVGFSTLRAEPFWFEGEVITAIFSGDTIVAPEARGSTALARAWIAKVNAVRAEAPGRRCYWLLLTSGFRTYRFLPVFWREFFPRAGRAIPARLDRLTRSLAASRYGADYDPVAGIVRFPHAQRLRPPFETVPDGRRENLDVAFFLERNPGHPEGDELVCLTEIGDGNLTPAGHRMLAAHP